MFLMISGNSC